jgi:hypothetical protein
VLVFALSQSEMVVRWGNVVSSPVKMCAGVRQGGVLSPVLFAIYINCLIVDLRQSGHGLSVLGIFVGCILYADDILLLANSLSDMQCMLNICSGTVESLDMSFNVSKSFVVRFGKRYNKECKPLLLNGLNIEFRNKVQYLGVTFKAGCMLRFDFSHATMAFYRAFNKLWNRCKFANSELTCAYIMQSVCMPVLTYGFEVVSVSANSIKKLEHLIDNAVGRVFNVKDRHNIMYIKNAIGFTDLSVLRKKRGYKFLVNFAQKKCSFSECFFRLSVLNNGAVDNVCLAGVFCTTNDLLCGICAAILEL